MRAKDILNEDWQKVNKSDKTDGMSSKAVKAYRRENPGSKLKTAVTTKPSKLKKGSKSAKRRKSFCSRMSGMKKAHASAKTKRDPDSPINKALRRWNCESIEEMRQLIEYAEKEISQEKILLEKWSQKYKSSINCSHPKGFSQRAHCAGKKKHNEDMSMEMVCEDCGMCQTHGNLNEIKKGQKDSNGFTKCWPGKHAEGTKKGKNGKPVRNCVPNESVLEDIENEIPKELLDLIDEYIAKVDPDADRDEIISDIVNGYTHPDELEYALQDDNLDLKEYGDTAKGQKMLTKVQKRAVDRVVSKRADTDPKYAKKNSDTANRAWERMTDKDLEEGKTQKQEAPKPRNFVAKNAVQSGAGAHKDKKKAAKQGDVKHKGKMMDIAEMDSILEKASRQLCKSSKPDDDLGASNLASCKSQGLRARDGEKSHLIGHGNSSVRIKVGGKRIKGKKYGGPLPDYGTRKGQ